MDINTFIKLYKRKRDNKYLSETYKKNYAIIGFGNHTIHNLFPVIQFLQLNIKYVCCSSTKKADLIGKKFKGIIGTTSIEDILIDDEIYGVFVSATPDSHFKIASNIIKSRKCIFIEKPPCLSLKDLNTLIELEQLYEHNTTVVGMQKRYSPVITNLCNKLKNKEIYSYNLRYQTGLYPEGNELYDLFIHPIDLAVFLFGEAEIFSAQKITSNKKGGITYLLMLKHNKVIGTLELSTLYSWKDAYENISINTQVGTYDIEQMEKLLFSPAVSSIFNIPKEKVTTTNGYQKSLFSRNNFNPILGNNQIYTQGYFNEIKMFVDIIEQNIKPKPETGFKSLLNTYYILEELNRL